ncbi:MAG: hypothetical protein Q7J85_09550 [Bacillota bacterium]|nr:hypothetical protein [Bacillota bacterium]
MTTNTGQCVATESKEQSLNEHTEPSLEKEYLSLINDTPDGKKYNITRHCFNRLPDSFALLEKLWLLQKESIADNTKPSITRRELIGDMFDAVSLFRKTCPVSDIEKADGIGEELDDLSKNVLEQLRQDEVNELSKLIKDLEECVHNLGNDIKDNELLEATEKIDRRINKGRLELYPELKQRYGVCSSKLMDIFKNDHLSNTNNDKVLDYNRQAISSHKNVQRRLSIISKRGFWK